MAQPVYDDSVITTEACLLETQDGAITISAALEELLLSSRQSYDWPAGTGKSVSQQRVIDLEARVATFLAILNPINARAIISEVGSWGGNRKKAQTKIEAASPTNQANMLHAIRQVIKPETLEEGLNNLCAIPGVGLVIATKVYRFCCPYQGAAIDRHASYFFNSLPLTRLDRTVTKVTKFRRQWAKGKYITSRLAIYTEKGRAWNCSEFISSYLPWLIKIANDLNTRGIIYICAATGKAKMWRPADVEMAAYFWWAQNGPR